VSLDSGFTARVAYPRYGASCPRCGQVEYLVHVLGDEQQGV
jgi:hypothetical protein